LKEGKERTKSSNKKANMVSLCWRRKGGSKVKKWRVLDRIFGATGPYTQEGGQATQSRGIDFFNIKKEENRTQRKKLSELGESSQSEGTRINPGGGCQEFEQSGTARTEKSQRKIRTSVMRFARG